MRGTEFLPVSREEMLQRDWYYYDFLVVTADAYIDHPSFGTTLIARMLEGEGYRVAILAQPDWHDAEAFRAMGRPRYGVLIGGGNLDQNIVINKDHAKEDGSKGCNSLAHSLAPPSSVFALSISSSITSPQVLRSMGLFSFFSMYTHNAIRQPNTKKPPGAWFIRLMRSILSGMMVIPIQVPLPKISRTEDMSSMVRM